MENRSSMNLMQWTKQFGHRFLGLGLALLILGSSILPGIGFRAAAADADFTGTVEQGDGSSPETDSIPAVTETEMETEPEAASPPDGVRPGPEATFAYEIVEDGVAITGFVPGQEQTALVIPETLGGRPVTEIGERAFIQSGLVSLTLNGALRRIGAYAFAANQIDGVVLNDALRSIGDYAFRDNLLSSIDSGQVETIGSYAFTSNRLTELTLRQVSGIGDGAFSGNQLSEVYVPTTVTSLGSAVFAYNDRYVLVHTENERIESEVVPGGFGHVVNPVTVTIRYLDEATGEEILDARSWGDDLTRLDGVVILDCENRYDPPAIQGYVALESPVLYVPDSTAYELPVYYRSTTTRPVIELVSEPRIAADGDGSRDVLLGFVRATDLHGQDISGRISVEPESIDTSVGGSVSVTYQVTDDYGNQAARTVEVWVGTDWYDFPLGNGWVLGDFSYDGNKVLGFSESGAEKVITNKHLVLPHVNPADGVTVIDTVAANLTDASTPTNFHSKGLESLRDYDNNIRVIEGSYGPSSSDRYGYVFQSNSLTEIRLDALEYVGAYAFRYNNRLESLSLPSATFVGGVAIAYCASLQQLDLPRVTRVDTWGLGSNPLLTSLSMPSLRETGSAAFINSRLSTVSFPELTTVGANTFAGNALTEVTQANFPRLTTIGAGAFRNNQISTLEIPLVTEIADASSSGNGAFYNNQLATILPGGLAELTVLGKYAFHTNKLTAFDAPKLTHVQAGALQNNLLTELHWPALRSIAASAVEGNPGLAEYGDNVVIWADDSGIPSRSNYVVNPDPELSTDPGQWEEADFTWDVADPGRVTGFSPSGKVKLAALGYELVLPPRALTVAASAFASMRLKTVSGARVKVIEDAAFYNNQLTTAEFPQLVSLGQSAFHTNQLTTVSYELLETIPYRAFYANPISGTVELPQTTLIGEQAFYGGTKKITALSAPRVIEIGARAFGEQPLESVHLPLVERIGVEAFYKSRITNLSLPAAVTIEDAAFAGNLIQELCLPRVETLGRAAFASNSLTRVELPSIRTLAAGDYYRPYIGNVTARGGVFAFNRITEAYLPLELTSLPDDAFRGNLTQNATRQPVMVFLPGGENPHGLEDGYLDQQRQHIINPTRVTVSYVDADGTPLAESLTEYIFAEKTYTALELFNYRPDKSEITVPDNRQVNEVRFNYVSLGLEGMATQGVEIYQRNELQPDSGLARERYYIGDQMTTRLFADLTGFAAAVTDGKLRLYYDVRYIDPGSVSIPPASSISGYTVRDGLIEISLKDIYGGFHIEIPITWRFRKYVTPDNYRMEINALFANGDEVYSVAEPIYLEGYYKRPGMYKTSPLNLPGYDYGAATAATNGPRLMGELAYVKLADGSYVYVVSEPYPVSFGFSVQGLERYVDMAVVTDQLPEYIAINADGVRETRTAVFRAEDNPAWRLEADGRTLVQEAHFAPTVSPGTYIKPLVLEFPDLLSGSNVVNQASIELTPHLRGLHEDAMTVQDDISIYAAFYQPLKYEGDPRFDKEHARRPHYDGLTAYFYDLPEEREQVIPFFLRVSSLARTTDLVDVRITDYGLDERLYYYGVSFPQSVGQSGGMTVTVVAWRQQGAVMDPGTDEILQVQTTTMGPANSIVFDEDCAREIDYIQIVLPEDHKVFSALEFHVDTKLREPERSHYDPSGLTSPNIFVNHALLSGNLYQKNTLNPASERTEPLTGPGGVVISSYSSDWDRIPGNYLWHERAEVNLRDYQVTMGVGKTQSFPTDRVVFPGETGSYQLRLRPMLLGQSDEGEGRAIIREELADFEMVDLLPQGVLPTAVRPNEGFLMSDGASYEIVDDYNGSGLTAIVFRARRLAAGVFDIASIEVAVEPDAAEGEKKNRVYVTFTNADVDKVGHREKPHGVSDDRDWLQAEVAFNLIKVRELFARKYIRGQGGGLWLPTGIVTASGEPFEYRLTVVNNLDDDRSGVDLVDFFPYPGDVSIQEQNIGSGIRPPRESEFRNHFDRSRPVQLPPGYTISYWNSDSDIDYQNQSADSIIDSLVWSPTPAANTRGIRVQAEAGTVLRAGGRIDVIIPMLAAENTVANNFDLTGRRAWNTFVRRGDSTLRFLEPNRVYNELTAPPGAIEFTKYGREGISGTEAVHVLPGATFELRDAQNNFVARASSNENGLVSFTGLSITETYTVREVGAPTGYLLAKGSLSFGFDDFRAAYDPEAGSFVIRVAAADSQAAFLNIKPIQGSLELDKINAEGTRLPLIRFRLNGLDEWNRDVDRTFVTDGQGHIRVTGLTEGSYRLSEIVLPDTTGYQPIAPITFTITADKRDHAFTIDMENPIVNEDVDVYINKLGVASDYDIEESIRDLTDFGRRRLDGYFFRIEAVDPTSSFAAVTVGPTVNGRVCATGLPVNELLTITEVKKDGRSLYRHNDQSYQFRINSAGQITDADGILHRQNVLNIPNPEKPVRGLIQAVKFDGEGQPLEGAVFALFRDDVEVVRATARLVGQEALATFADIEPGTYVLREIAAPHGYARSNDEFLITVPQRVSDAMLTGQGYEFHEDRIVRRFRHSFSNLRFRVLVTKGDDIRENIPLAEAEAIVAASPDELGLRMVGPARATVYRKLAGVPFDLYQLPGGSPELCGRFYSDASGIVDFADFAFVSDAVYHLVEVEAPEGYVLDSRPVVINTALEAKLDGFNGEIRRYRVNRPIRGRIIISKYDEDERSMLAGATFAIYRATDTDFAAMLESGVTDASGLLEFRDLEPGDYVIREEGVPAGYQDLGITRQVTVSESSGTVRLVINNPPLVAFDVKKVWVGSPGTEVTVAVLANGEAARDVDGRLLEPVTLAAGNDWTARFERLPKYDEAGGRIDYSIHEEAVEGYRTLVTGTATEGFTVVNTQEGLLSVGVTKVWEGAGLDAVTVYLLADGERTGESVVLNAENRWQHVFTMLPETRTDAAGEKVPIRYAVEEEALEGYLAAYSGSQEEGFVITNIEQPLRDIAVRKEWEGQPLAQVTVTLLADGEPVGEPVQLDAGGNWEHVFADLPLRREAADGSWVDIVYDIEESPCEGYRTEILGDVENGFVIVNHELPLPPTAVAIRKVWQGTQLEAVTVSLLADDEVVDTVELSEANEWSWIFENLPQRNEAGQDIVYSVAEAVPEGYRVEISGDAVTGFVITNYEDETPTSMPEDVEPTEPVPSDSVPKTGRGADARVVIGVALLVVALALLIVWRVTRRR
ncbi:MAG: Cna B-type domain-containing protein [Bacillota bacterium]|nr:Cna B-type domain-containing protein [Bacillota bacterium]